MFDLTEIQKRVEAIVGQSQTVTEGNDDWNLRSSYINRAQQDWANRFEWPQLYREIFGNLSTATGNATISMPSDFRKLMGHPKIGNNQYSQIDANERERFNVGDRFSYVLGNPSGGYNLIVNYPATASSGASYFIPYQKTVASLVSGFQVSECPNPDYIVQQTLYYYFLANEDERFQDARSEAERILANLLEFENVYGPAHANSVDNVDEVKHNFRWGRN